MIARRLASISALNCIDYGIRFGAVLVVTPFLLGQIGKETYGLWLFLVSLLGYLNLAEVGLSNTAVRYFGTALRSSDDSASLFSYFQSLYRRVGIAAILLALSAAGLARWFSPDPATARAASLFFLLGGGVLGVTFFFRVRVAMMKAQLHYRAVIVASLTRFLANTAGIFLLVPRFPSLLTLIILWTVAAALEQGLLWFQSRPIIPDPARAKSLEPERRKEIFGFARKSLANIASDYLRNRADTVVLGTMVSVTSVTYYGVGTRFLILFQDLATAVFGGHLLSAFSRLTPDRRGMITPESVFRAFRFSVPFACLGGAALLLLGPSFIDLWLGAGYEETHVVLWWLAIPYTLVLMQLPVNPWIGAQNRHGWFAISKFAGGFMNLIASIVLVTLIGFPGVIIATAIEMTLLTLVAWPALLHRQCSLPIHHYLGALGRPLLRLLPSLVGTCAITIFWKTDSWIDFLMQGSLFVIAFAANTWLLILGSRERDLALSFLKRNPDRSKVDP